MKERQNKNDRTESVC